MTDEEKEDIVESQLTKKDRKEIQDGMCVNCALVSFILTFIMILAVAL